MPVFEEGHAGSVEVGGDLFGLLTDRPAAASLLAWLTSADAQRSWASVGGILSANTRVTGYPDRVTQREAAVLTGADQVRFDASDQMLPHVEAAFRRAILEVTAEPTDLDIVLERLETLSAPSGRGPRP
jgi:alpha-glucoside transport system substrate-binding protein